jgi:hypothetical protein
MTKGMGAMPLSWPGLTRPSTSSASEKTDVDARHKAGHDDWGSIV